MNCLLTNPMCFCTVAHVKYVYIYMIFPCDISVYSALFDYFLLWFTVEIPAAGNMLSKLHHKQLVGSPGQSTSHDACCGLLSQ